MINDSLFYFLKILADQTSLSLTDKTYLKLN